MRTKHLGIGALAFVAAAAWAPRVYAQKVDATVQVDARSISGDKDQPPDLVARIISGSAPPAMDKIILVETGTGPKKNIDIEIPATDVKTYVQGDETLGIAVVFETDWLWLGNESWWPKEASRTEGYYKPLTAALDKLNVAGPPGSKGALIAYGAGSNVKWQGDLKDLTGDKIGTERELTLSTIKVEPTQDNPEGLSGVQQLDVAAGVDDAISALNKMGVSRKVLIIIGDGNHADTLGDYKKKLQSDDITCYAIGIASLIPDQLPGDENGWKKIAGPNAKWITAPEEIGNKIGAIVDGLADRYYVRFPGADIKLKKSFTWDEQPHDFVLRGIAPKDYELPDPINLTPAWVPPWMRHAKKSIWSWLWIPFAAVGGLLLLIIGVKVIGGRKKEPEPMPVPVVAAAPVAAPAPAPAPAGPMKTVMIGIGGDDQGFPVVGWIVPLNGANQFQTFKLQGGATKIGTGGDSHIVINDGFMSTVHAQIVASPAGFVLVDGGSTNGTLVNDRRVDKHELVDNDVFTMGKTNFRFKSIN